jgi:hypothetical protein
MQLFITGSLGGRARNAARSVIEGVNETRQNAVVGDGSMLADPEITYCKVVYKVYSSGITFSGCFHTKPDAVFKIGHRVSLTPQCEDHRWEEMIASCGIGYMVNTVTKCPLHRQTRPTVTVCEAPLLREIPGVSYDSVLVLRAGSNGIVIGEPIISLYEGKKSKAKFQFICTDPVHYATVGRNQPSPQ